MVGWRKCNAFCEKKNQKQKQKKHCLEISQTLIESIIKVLKQI